MKTALTIVNVYFFVESSLKTSEVLSIFLLWVFILLFFLLHPVVSYLPGASESFSLFFFFFNFCFGKFSQIILFHVMVLAPAVNLGTPQPKLSFTEYVLPMHVT